MTTDTTPTTSPPAIEFKLVVNWREILTRAWSIRFLAVAAGLSGAEVALPIMDGYVDIPRGVFAGMSALATVGAFVARFVAQTRSIPSSAQGTDNG